jgi:transposase
MIAPSPNVRVWLACGHTDMRRGFDGLSLQVQQRLSHDPFSGELFVFRGRRGDLIKILVWDGQGLCLFSKVIAHPATTGGWTDNLAASTNWRTASTEAWLAFAVLATERKAA